MALKPRPERGRCWGKVWEERVGNSRLPRGKRGGSWEARSKESQVLLMQALQVPGGSGLEQMMEQMMMDRLPLAATGLRLGRSREAGEVAAKLGQVCDDGDSGREGGGRGWIVNIF